MQQVYRFGPAPEQPARHLFVFLHASGADARSMIPAAFKYQGRFPSAALVVPSGFSSFRKTPDGMQWFSTKDLSYENHMDRVRAILPRIEQIVRHEQASYRVPVERTVLIGYSQGGTVALEAVKAIPELAGAVVAYSARFASLPKLGTRLRSRIHLVHGGYDSVVSRVHAERAARVLAGLHVPVTLDIIEHDGHALSHEAICRGSLRLLQGIYERRRATLH
ncbi:MAG TPA: dienelactone hydrolase family protein [Burkholderiales bacterium]|jgi:phospholipase/carboxylesterase|nr:dienelactone hydrolase family protein [Burkholderiales bacterium]